MSSSTLTILAEQAVLPGRDELVPAAIDIDLSTGKVTAVRDVLEAEDGAETLTIPKGKVLLPGLIDADVYISEPNHEGFSSGTRASLSGGVTTLIDVPDSQSTTLAGLEEKRARAAKKSDCDVGFWGGIIPGNEDELGPLLKAGVRGFKCTLTTFDLTFPAVTEDDIKRACDLLPADTVIVFHAELGDSIPLGETPYGQLQIFVTIAFGLLSAEIVKRTSNNPFAFYGVIWVTALLTVFFGFASSQPTPTITFRGIDMSTWLAIGLSTPLAVMAVYDFAISEPKEGVMKIAAIGLVIAMAAGFIKANEFSPLRYSNYLRTRPSKLEDDAISLIQRIAKAYPNLRFHISPLSSTTAIPTDPLPNLTISTAPHYLSIHDAAIPPGTWGQPLSIKSVKTHPPIRDAANLSALTTALHNGDITSIVSSHNPATPKEKSENYFTSLRGISSLGLTLPLLHTLGLPLPRIVDWMGIKLALLTGLAGTKGEIRTGADADFVIFDPEVESVIEESTLLFKHKHSPYIGKTVRGLVEATYLRGEKVYDKSGGAHKTGQGRVI